ncbi:histidine phosphatase family protein [Deinococcus sp. AJ005]|uniref:histidine phosphatase family protein n=1 Tax=Deinococcus sp. AJ005 TaxID=2652443 RepID=UPI001CF62EE9|nr:histidine phosphatase family protein [Deinococcus sp. AJ005]
MTLTLYLVRHAATAPNAQRRYPHADEDAPLSPEGRAVAAGLKLPLHATAHASPSLRTRETAELAGFSHVIAAPALAEAAFGVIAGQTWAELEAQFGDTPRGWIDGLSDPEGETGPPGGETGRAFHARIQNWLTQLPQDGDVIAFTHAGPLLAALRLCVGLRAAEIAPGGVAVLRRAEGHWWLRELRQPRGN